MSDWPFKWDDSVRFDVNDMFMRVYLRNSWVNINRVPARAGQARAGDATVRVPGVEPVEAFIRKWKTAHMRLVVGASPQFGPDFSQDFGNDFDSVRLHLYREDLKKDAKGDFSDEFSVDFEHGLSGSFSSADFDSSFDRERNTDYTPGLQLELDNSFSRDEFDTSFTTN